MNKTMKKTKKLKAVKKETPKFEMDLNFKGSDLNYNSKGDSIIEALDNLNIDKFKLRTYGVFILKNGKKKGQLQQTPFQIKRLLFNKVAKEIFEKKILMTMK